MDYQNVLDASVLSNFNQFAIDKDLNMVKGGGKPTNQSNFGTIHINE